MSTKKKQDKTQKKKSCWTLDTLIVGSSAIVLLLCDLSTWVSPESFMPLAFTGLVFPYVLLAFVVGLVIRASRGDFKGLIWPIVVTFLLWPSITSTFGGMESHKPSEEVELSGEELSVTSFNVRRMDEYGWSGRDNTRAEIANWIGNNIVDLYAFQEFPSKAKLEVLRKLHGYKFYTVTNGAGPAITTSKRVINNGKWLGPEDELYRGVWVDLISGEDTIRVINVHLQSVGFGKSDYEAVRDGTDSEDRSRLLDILSKAYEKRAAQAEALREFIDLSPYSVILTGDFNDTPVSYATSTVKGDEDREVQLFDAFNSAGGGLGATYVGDLPGLRIDFIMHSEQLIPTHFTTHSLRLSDHRPVSAIFSH